MSLSKSLSKSDWRKVNVNKMLCEGQPRHRVGIFGDSNAYMYNGTTKSCIMNPREDRGGFVQRFCGRGVPLVQAWAMPATPMSRLCNEGNQKSKLVLNTINRNKYGAVVFCFGFVDMNFSYFKFHSRDTSGACFEDFMRARIENYMKFCEKVQRAFPGIRIYIQEVPYNCITDPKNAAKNVIREVVQYNNPNEQMRSGLYTLRTTRHVVLACNIHYTDMVNNWLMGACAERGYSMLRVNHTVLEEGGKQLCRGVIFKKDDTHYKYEFMTPYLKEALQTLHSVSVGKRCCIPNSDK
jgi:hypothetical protein